MDISRKKTYIILSIILSFTLVVNMFTFKNGHNWGGDFAAYIHQAKSIVDGSIEELDSLNKFRFENSTVGTGNVSTPWGFPVLLAPLYYFFGFDIHIMKIFVNLFFLLSLIAVFHLFRDSLSNLQNLLLVTTIAFNPWFFNFKDNVLTDIPFLFFCTISLLFIKNIILEKKKSENKILSHSLIGVFILISCTIRSAGLVLLPTLFFIQLVEIRRSNRKLMSFFSFKEYHFIPYIVFLVFTFLLGRFLPGDSNTVYLSYVSTLSIERMISDIKYYTVLPSRFFPFLFINMNVTSFDYNKFSLVIYGAILSFVLLSMLRSRKKNYMYIFLIILTLVIVMVFSRRQGFRLIIPIFPFFLYYLFTGLSMITMSFSFFRKNNPLTVRADLIFGLAIVLISLFYISNTGYQNIAFNKTMIMDGPYSSDSKELFNHIKLNVKKEDAIIFFKPRVMSLYTDRKSFSLKPDVTVNELHNSSAEYIAYNKKISAYVLTAKDINRNFYCMFKNKTFMLCSLKKYPDNDSSTQIDDLISLTE